MSGPYHEGELAAQERAGTRAMASKIGRGIHDAIPEAARDLVAGQRMVIVGSVGADGAVWASLLTGPPGFLEVTDAQRLWIDATPAADDPLAANLAATGRAGVLVIDLATRRRLRVNGSAERLHDGGIVVRAAEVFWNCPKYIQLRMVAAEDAPVREGAVTGATLTPDQQRRIAGADTFFLASAHPIAGVDVSHRGGEPGFVRVTDDRTVVWPDYAGNGMFQSLGNLTVAPRCGLLLVDFTDGTALQLSGTARIEWDGPRVTAAPGAERVIEVTIQRAIETRGASPLRWRLFERSPFNPR